MKIKEFIFLGTSLIIITFISTSFLLIYSGQLNSYILGFTLCFGLPGISLLVWGLARQRTKSLIGVPQLRIPKGTFQPNDLLTVEFVHKFPKNVTLKSIIIQLVLRETAVDTSGTNDSIKTHDKIFESVNIANGEFHAGEVITKTCHIHIPPNSTPTLIVKNNRLQWFIQAKFDIPNLPDLIEEQEVIVKAPPISA